MIKRRSALLAALLLTLSLGGCQGAAPPDVPPPPESQGPQVLAQPVYPEAYGAEDYDARYAVRKENQVSDATREAIRAFAGAAAPLVLADTSQNTVYSPLSLYMALAMTGAGTAGQTRQEFSELLRAPGGEMSLLSGEMGRLFRVLYYDNESGYLRMANSLWLASQYDFHQDYLDQMSRDFYASAHHVSFATPETDAAMSQWIADNTGGLLTPRIESREDWLIALINTIDLSADWLYPAREEDTKEQPFTLADGSQVPAQYLCVTDEFGSYVDGDGYIASSWLFQDPSRGSMVFVLPDQGVTPARLLADPDFLPGVLTSEKRVESKMIYEVPKFSFDSNMELSDAMKALGLKAAFTGGADFSPMTDEPAWIDAIKQEVHVEIDEEGVRAAAYTIVEMMTGGGPQPSGRETKMILDRPFLFIITGEQELPLFVGVVARP